MHLTLHAIYSTNKTIFLYTIWWYNDIKVESDLYLYSYTTIYCLLLTRVKKIKGNILLLKLYELPLAFATKNVTNVGESKDIAIFACNVYCSDNCQFTSRNLLDGFTEGTKR